MLHLLLSVSNTHRAVDSDRERSVAQHTGNDVKPRDPDLLLQHAPFIRQGMTTASAMVDVLIALAPATLAALWYFGFSALLVIAASIAGAVLTEIAFISSENRGETLLDGSGLVTGLLLGLTLPSGLPMWMAFVGGAVAIGLGKAIWGGLGGNLFNPALVGRAFLLATFPIAMTTWTAPDQSFWSVEISNLDFPFTYTEVDGISAATPLGLMKFDQQATPLTDLFFGNTAGSLGETSALLLILGGIYLYFRRDLDWRIPLSIVLTVLIFSTILYFFDAQRFATPTASIFSGGLVLGAVYMATDPVTSPTTPLGTWIFGIGIGLLVVLIRGFGGMPEGVMYAILLMNAATPLIDRFTQPRIFGHLRRDRHE
jgi:electron transport complex protein RnfD